MALSGAAFALFPRLALALGLGVLIGAERGWHERAAAEGGRVAGIRTFGLIGLLGGLAAILARELGAAVFGFAFLALAGVMVAARLWAAGRTSDYGMTTVVAALLTFAFGALAVAGEPAPAAAAGFLAALLLWRRSGRGEADTALALENPFELTTALKFGLFLAFIVLAAKGLRLWLGDGGLLALAAASGLADVDAINLSLARLVADGLAPEVAAGGILLAAASNTLLKGALALALAGPKALAGIALALGPALLAGLAGYALAVA